MTRARAPLVCARRVGGERRVAGGGGSGDVNCRRNVLRAGGDARTNMVAAA